MIKTISFLMSFLLIINLSCRGQVDKKTTNLKDKKFQEKPTVLLTLFAEGFSRISDIQNAGDGRLFVTEQGGKIRIIDSLGNKLTVPFLDITSKVKSSGSEQGLLGLAFSPNYKEDGKFYVHYTNFNGPAGNIVISRFRRNPSNDNLANSIEEKLMEVYNPFANHNGGQIGFGKDGYLYIGLGDGGSGGDPGNRAQNLDTLLGKMLRIDVSKDGAYSIPSTNPYAKKPDAREEIWASGLRNPWRWSFDKLTQDLWIADVGQNAWEEVNFQKFNSNGGENYGWKCYEGNATYANCSIENPTFPVYVYAHNSNNCSVTGGYVYRGAQFSDMFGRYFLTDYCSGRLMSIYPDSISGWIIDTIQTLPAINLVDISTFGQDVNAELYIAGNTSGKIWKLSSQDCKPVAFILNGDSVESCGSVMLNAIQTTDTLLKYQWMKDNIDINNATNSFYNATQNGNYSVKVTKNECNSVSEDVTIRTDFCTNIKEQDRKSRVNIYPNPSKNYLNLQINFESILSQKAKIFIYKINGEQVETFERMLNPGENLFNFARLSLSAGVYFINVVSDKINFTEKFIVD